MTTATDFVPLRPHPLTPSSAVHALAVQLRRTADGDLALRYRLHADLARLRIPASQAPERRDGLWAHTCFELFVAAPDSAAYREYNFSPSGLWAAYAFRGYRERDDALDAWPPAPPPIRMRAGAGLLELDARVALPVELPPGAPLLLGLTAVVEDADGALSYWALRHPGARPDFHLREGFALTLGPADAPPATEGHP
jgi:hypothetical protein